MEPVKPIWTDHYTVSWYDADATNKAGILSVCKYLQESAWNHANHFGFGYRTATEVNQVWVIVRLLVKMKRYPSWGETIVVKTWPGGMDGLLAQRDFEVLDATGNRIGVATSQWFIIDAVTRKPQASIILRDILPLVVAEPVMEEKPEKIKFPGPLPFHYTQTARYGDIDMYQHVNNTRYLEWSLNLFPEEVHRGKFLSGVLIEFLAETRIGDEIQLFADTVSNPALVRGVRQEDDKMIFRARFTWQ